MNWTGKPEVDAFLADIVEVYRKHGLSLSHEDSQGGFEVEPLSEYNIRWLSQAHDRTGGQL